MQVEALEELAAISLADDPQQADKTALIAKLTDQAMQGKLSFADALTKRLELLRAHQSHLAELVMRLKKKISPSLLNSFHNHQSFWSAHQVFIISGGFKDYIIPVAALCGIDEDRVFANDFCFDEKDKVIGYNSANPLAHSGGKPIVVEQIRNQPSITPVIILGDGWTDYEIRQQGQADRFFVFTANVRRPQVVAQADGEAANAEQFIQLVNQTL